jgi:hypothetical protein
MRWALRCAIVVLLSSFLSSTVRATILDGPVVDPANGYSYYIISSASWMTSEAQAQAMGGHLAIITSAAENTWIFNTFDPYVSALPGDMWIGFSDSTVNDGTGSQHAADFKWANDAPVTYTNWSAGEPNNDPNLGGEYYACMVGYSAYGETPGEWNDKNNTGSLTPSYGLVQVPEPASLGLTIGVLGLLTMRRRGTRAASKNLRLQSSFRL